MTDIRAATREDEPAIRTLLVAAFGGPVEADLMEPLREHGAVLVELVAVEAGRVAGDRVVGDRVVGHIAFSRLWVENGQRLTPAVALAPLGVHPDFQNQAIGGALVEAGHAQLRALKERLSVVVGDVAFYSRFGYSREAAAGFTSTYQPDYLTALALSPSAPRTGTLRYDPAFEGH
jgi:putative acetyltransferase